MCLAARMKGLNYIAGLHTGLQHPNELNTVNNDDRGLASDVGTDDGDGAILLAFDTGLGLEGDNRHEKIYLQNFFCSLMGVRTDYPFRDELFQQALWNTPFPSSYLYQSILYLALRTDCGGSAQFGVRQFHFEGAEKSNSGGSSSSSSSSSRSSKSKNKSRSRSSKISDSGGSGSGSSSSVENVSVSGTREGDSAVDIGYFSEDSRKDINDDNNSNYYYSNNKSSTDLGQLWISARGVATTKNEVVVLLATAGYADLLANFFCSITALIPPFRNFLVLTMDDDVVALAAAAGVGVYRPQSRTALTLTKLRRGRGEGAWEKESEDGRDEPVALADFGTLTYQQLMLFRTETVMTLLMLGFKVMLLTRLSSWI